MGAARGNRAAPCSPNTRCCPKRQRSLRGRTKSLLLAAHRAACLRFLRGGVPCERRIESFIGQRRSSAQQSAFTLAMAAIFRKAAWAFVNHPAPEWVKLTGAIGLFVGLAVYSVSSESGKTAADGAPTLSAL